LDQAKGASEIWSIMNGWGAAAMPCESAKASRRASPFWPVKKGTGRMGKSLFTERKQFSRSQPPRISKQIPTTNHPPHPGIPHAQKNHPRRRSCGAIRVR
jgi:hypothetical protein